MKLTQDAKQTIDRMSYHQLLCQWRFAPLGDTWFQGETGDYWKQRMDMLQKEGVDHTAVSKSIGWEK